LIHTEGIGGISQQFRVQHGHPELLEDVLAKGERTLTNTCFPADLPAVSTTNQLAASHLTKPPARAACGFG
jgi:hypothetical protein